MKLVNLHLLPCMYALSLLVLLPMSLSGQDIEKSVNEIKHDIELNGVFLDILGIVPQGQPDTIELIDSSLNIIAVTLGKNDPLYEEWLWKKIDTYVSSQRYSAVKSCLDSLASIYETSQGPDYCRLYEYYSYYYLYIGYLNEASECMETSLRYARTPDQKLTAMKTLRDISQYTDPTGNETVEWCMKMEPYLKTKEYSGSYIDNIDICFFAGGDSVDLVSRTKAFRDWTEYDDEKASAELELWTLTGWKDTSYLHNVINDYQTYRAKRISEEYTVGERNIKKKDQLFFSYYMTALSEMMLYCNEMSNTEQLLRISQRIIDLFEHPDTTNFYARLHERTLTSVNKNIHEFYIPALMNISSTYANLTIKLDSREYYSKAFNTLKKIYSVYKKDIEFLTYYVRDMPDYDIKIYLDSYYSDIQYLCPQVRFNSADSKVLHKDLISLLLFYKGLLLRNNELVPAQYKAEYGLFSFEYAQSLLKQYPGNAYFIDFTYVEYYQYYLLSIIGKDSDTPAAAVTDRICMESLDYNDIYSNGDMYNRIWSKISDICPEGSTIFFVPDKDLYRTNIEMLPDDNGVPASEKYQLHRLSSFLEMAHDSNACPMNTAAIFGTSAPDLKAVADEIQAIDTTLSSNGMNVVLYEKEKANVDAFLELSGHSPDIIHLSTHGFYLDNEEFWNSEYFQANYSGPEYYDRSMINSGLRFNRNCPDDSDILFSKDVASMELDSTALVVLASCESGLGDTSYDGVLGLQRAFKIAGAQTVILTLWNVSDLATALFTTSFYSHLTECKNIRASFNAAVKTVREKFQHPYYWAGFIVVD